MCDQFLAPLPATPSLACGFRYMQGRDPLLESTNQVERTAAAITTRHQLTAWVQGPLRTLIPHEKALLGLGQIGYSTLRIDAVHAVDLADTYSATRRSATQHLISPVMVKWLERRAPQIILPSAFCRLTHARWLNNLKRHRIENGVFDANVESGTGLVSFIKLFNVGSSLESSSNLLAQRITPLLAGIWKRIDSQLPNTAATQMRRVGPPITVTEQGVVRWLREGKTNWEIGQILGKSEFTVKTQIQTMLKKTGLKNRHALAASDC